MRITYSTEKNGDYVIHVYLSNTNKKTEDNILKRIPSVMKDIREQKKINKKIEKMLEIHNTARVEAFKNMFSSVIKNNKL